MKDKRAFWVVHLVDGRWGVKREGEDRYRHIELTQAVAIAKGKVLAQLHEVELKIQGLDGKIRDSWSYGPDPYPPRG